MDMPAEERAIGGSTYRVVMLPLGKWLELESLVLGLFAAPLEELLRNLKGGDIGAVQVDEIAPALRQLAERLRADDVKRLLGMVALCTYVKEGDGWSLLDESRQNYFWPRHMRELVGALAFFLEVQFRDFFAGALDMVTGGSGAE